MCIRDRSICYGNDGAFVELFRSQNVSIHHNWSSGNVVTFEAAGDTSGIKIWRNEVANEAFLVMHQANNMTVTNNTVWNMTGAMIFFPSGFGNGSTAGFVFTNNLIVAAKVAFFYVDKQWGSGAVVSHNLYYASDRFRDFGCMNGVCYSTLSGWRSGTRAEANSMFTNPRLTSPSNSDFSLRSDSPAIDRGQVIVGITEASTGSRPDIGAREYGM